jgi:hypothetical protein
MTGCDTPGAVVSYTGPGKFVQHLFSGWELSGNTLFQTGTPFSIVNGGSNLVSVLDNAGVANGLGAGSYPDVVRSVGTWNCAANNSSTNVANGPLMGDPCDFVAPRGLTFGNSGRNYMNNPSRLNFDAALRRQFAMAHDTNLEIRAEAFNLFNHPQYRIFDPEKGNTSSNTISCYGDAGSSYSAGAASCQGGNAFLHPVDAHRPRTLQFGVKFAF